MGIYIIDTLESIWQEGPATDYSIFDKLKESYGIYIFRNPSDSCILYVGEARKQTLKERIRQNLRANDTGGTFRKNYLARENTDFNSFKKFLAEMQLIVIEAEPGMIIRALESLLILALNPVYNKDV